MKKTLIIISIVLGVAAMGLGVYFAWKKSKEILTPPPATGQKPIVQNQNLPVSTGNQNQQAQAAKLKVLSDQPVFDYWVYYPAATSTPIISKSTSSIAVSTSSPAISLKPEIFYASEDGRILKVSAKGGPASGGKESEDEVVSSDVISNLQSIKASPDGKMVLVKYGDLINPQFSLFNVETKVWQKFSDISAAAFSPDNKKIAYFEKTSGSLVTKDLLGAKPKTTKVVSINQKDFDLSWILPDKILLVPKPSFDYESQIWAVDLKNKTLNSLASGRGLMVNWSSDGKMGIRFRSTEARVPEMTLINDSGDALANLDFSTLPDKCLIKQPQIYCAIPQTYNSVQEPLLPDDYLKRAVYFQDFIYSINTIKNSFAPIFFAQDPAIDATHLSLVENELIFINRYDNKLYGFGL